MATVIMTGKDEDGMPEVEILESYEGEFEEQFIQQMWEQEEAIEYIWLEDQNSDDLSVDSNRVVTDEQLEVFKEAWAENQDWSIPQLKWILKCVREAYPKDK
ncbi:MAG: hypothetical protein GXO26_00515 [Crenarchaeota archaeon]|nr:hypothetical protein [Thermoproteota archaeon]